MNRIQLITAVACLACSITWAAAQDTLPAANSPPEQPKTEAAVDPAKADSTTNEFLTNDPQSNKTATEKPTPIPIVIHGDQNQRASLLRLLKSAETQGLIQISRPSDPGRTVPSPVAPRNTQIELTLIVPKMNNAFAPAASSSDAEAVGDPDRYISIWKSLFETRLFSEPILVDLVDLANGLEGYSAYARINASADVPYATVLSRMKALNQAGIADVSFVVGGRIRKANDSQPNQAMMILLNPDWSKSPTATEVEADLKAAFKDVAISNEVRANLLIAGPKILFAQENISVYSPAEAKALLGWLKKHQLITETHPFSLDTASIHGKAIANQGENRSPADISTEYTFRDEQGLLTIQGGDTENTHPFIHSLRCWEWKVRIRTTNVSIEYEDQRLQRLLGKSDYEKVQQVQQFRQSFDLPTEKVAIIHGFAGKRNLQMTGFDLTIHGSTFGTVSGLEPLIFVTHDSFDRQISSTDARVAIPESIIPVPEGGLKSFRTSGPMAGAMGMPGGVGTGRSPGMRSGMGSTGRGMGPESASAAARNKAVEAETQELKVFTLKYAKSDDVFGLVHELLGGNVKLSTDGRTNSIVANGSPNQLDKVTKLLAALDVEVLKPSQIPNRPIAGDVRSSISDAQGSNSPAATATQNLSLSQQLAKRRADSNTKELLAKNVATELREFRRWNPQNHQQLENETAKLRRVVAEAFTARQELLRTELQAFEQRLQKQRQAIDVRDRVQESIVDRRVEYLLNPDYDWDAKFSAQATDTSDRQLEAASTLVPTPQVAANPLSRQSQGSSLTSPFVTQAADEPGFIRRSPEEFDRLLDSARKEVQQAETAQTSFIQQAKSSRPNVTLTELQNEEAQKNITDGHFAKLLYLKRRLALIENELTTQIKLFEIDVREAESTLQLLEKDLNRVQQLNLKGVIPTSELEAQQGKYQAAKLKLDRARLKLELYSGIGKPISPTPKPDPELLRY